ncbi:MAG: hypothetical protein JSW00_05745 [Thermoplasmata archaeon]|nr:MAG: hypothetical protein JSW00_05745 [Thermoplasmata archaeon]
MFEPIHKKVKKWLETTIENSESAIDHGWTVEIAEGDERLMVIDTPQMPFKILVQVDDDLTYCAFLTGINTKNVKAEEIEPILRGLLAQNRFMGLSKFCLIGEDDAICLRTDLYSKYMNKDEFNLALEAVIVGGRWLIAELGQTEDENRMVKEMSSLGAAELLKGTSKEEVVAKMSKAGYPEDKAKAMVNKLVVELGLESPPEAEEAKEPVKEEIQEQKGKKENPVDKYIW